jgi:hypothetical protein
VNPNNTLIWEGKPYLPIGVRIPGTPEEIEKAAAAGIKDFLIELPPDGTGWAPAFAALESHQCRYSVVISSAAPSTPCYVVEPQAYRRDGLQGRFSISVAMNGATSVLAALVAKRDGTLRWTQKFPVTEGTVKIMGDASGTEQVLLLYPQMRTLDVPDFWDGFDQHRDTLLRALKQSKPGPGLRGIINPLGDVIDFPDRTNGSIPTSPLFQLELESRLTERYRTVGNLTKAWAMGTNDLDSFRHASRLIPLWSGTRGAGAIWDPKTDKTYSADLNHSEIWSDIREAIAGSMDRRVNRLVQAIRQAVDVPVTQEWVGWDGPYTLKSQMLAGVGGRLTVTDLITLSDSASMPASTVLRRGTGMLMATSIPLSSGENSHLSLQEIIHETEDLGYRGWYFRAERPEDLTEISSMAASRATDIAAANMHPSALFYPLGARNPASPSRVPGTQMWWLPSPGEGDRVDFGSDILGYRVSGGKEPLVAMWTREGTRRVRLRASDPKALVFRTVDGSNPDPRVSKKTVEVTISTSPLIIVNPTELPVPEESFVEVSTLNKKLIDTFQLKVDAGGSETFEMRENIRVFDTSPGPAYLTLVEQLRRLLNRSAPFVWIEAESIRQHSFSDIINAQGASAAKAMRLDVRLPSPEKGYSLDFSYEVAAARTVRVWVAGRMSDDTAKKIRVLAGANSSGEPSAPVQTYGDGFAWRDLGDLELIPGQNLMRLIADLSEGVVDIDVIVLADANFHPEGGVIPRQWATALPVPKRETGSGGLSTPPPIPPGGQPR